MKGKKKNRVKGRDRKSGGEKLGAAKVKEIVARVRRFAEPACESEGMELVHVEFQREAGGRIIRLYIDKPGGILLDDCSNLSRQVSDFLDVGVQLEGAYNLEVTSPGVERPLVKAADFEKFAGRTARVKTARPIQGRKNYKGILRGVRGEAVRLTVDGETVDLPLEDIARARLVDEALEKLPGAR
ncbi:MAG: ribosome maturation factor RimP [Desulfobacterales bacterium]|nr:ribosome maturation factor RimP [Desulfobacterales bacterium]